MDISSKKTYTIFRDDVGEKVFYKINMSKKDKKTDKVIYGTVNCRFKKDVELENKTKIKLINAFLDFYLNQNNKTVLYVYVNEFEIVEE